MLERLEASPTSNMTVVGGKLGPGNGGVQGVSLDSPRHFNN
jgi:hypothetical protein